MKIETVLENVYPIFTNLYLYRLFPRTPLALSDHYWDQVQPWQDQDQALHEHLLEDPQLDSKKNNF